MDREAWQTPVHGVAKSLTTAAAAKSLQSRLTLCDPIEGSQIEVIAAAVAC